MHPWWAASGIAASLLFVLGLAALMYSNQFAARKGFGEPAREGAMHNLSAIISPPAEDKNRGMVGLETLDSKLYDQSLVVAASENSARSRGQRTEFNRASVQPEQRPKPKPKTTIQTFRSAPPSGPAAKIRSQTATSGFVDIAESETQTDQDRVWYFGKSDRKDQDGDSFEENEELHPDYKSTDSLGIAGGGVGFKPQSGSSKDAKAEAFAKATGYASYGAFAAEMNSSVDGLAAGMVMGGYGGGSGGGMGGFGFPSGIRSIGGTNASPKFGEGMVGQGEFFDLGRSETKKNSGQEPGSPVSTPERRASEEASRMAGSQALPAIVENLLRRGQQPQQPPRAQPEIETVAKPF